MPNYTDAVAVSTNTEQATTTKYDFTQRMFPSDLGSENSYNNHWLVININVQDSPSFNNRSDLPVTSTILNGVYSRSDEIRFGETPGGVPSNVGQQILDNLTNPQNLVNRPRSTKRIKESIALYMPNSEVTYSDNHEFQNISLTKFAAGVATGGASLLAGIAGAATPGGLTAGISAVQGVQSASQALYGLVGNISGTLFNRPINPRVELLFANTFQREFTFDFMFAPSNEEESKSLENIIRTLRFHAAPESRGSDGTAATNSINLGDAFVQGVDNVIAAFDSFFWVPPSEFDITFYHNGSENTKIPRINTCVLKSIDVSYAPAGTYSTFSNGYPVQTRMVLRFTEVEVTHKKRVLQGF